MVCEKSQCSNYGQRHSEKTVCESEKEIKRPFEENIIVIRKERVGRFRSHTPLSASVHLFPAAKGKTFYYTHRSEGMLFIKKNPAPTQSRSSPRAGKTLFLLSRHILRILRSERSAIRMLMIAAHALVAAKNLAGHLANLCCWCSD